MSVRIRERIMEIYKETKSVMRWGKEVKMSWEEVLDRGGSQDKCPLSPLLFNLLVTDIKVGLGRDEVGGVKAEGN